MSQPVLRLGLIYLLSDNIKKKKCVCLIERERDSEGGTKKDLRGKRGFVP